MKKLFLVFVMTTITYLPYVLAGDNGHGGGGIVRNGEYLTFGSARVSLSPKPLTDIPGVKLAVKTIASLLIPDSVKGDSIEDILPHGKRQYYSINDTDLDPGARQQLIETYGKIIKKPESTDTLILFAVTSDLETYLLPEFFKLNETQQAAVIYHESVWARIHRNDPFRHINDLSKDQMEAIYKFIVSAEMNFEKYLSAKNATGYDVDLLNSFDRIFRTPLISIYAAFQADKNAGRLHGLLYSDGRLLANEILKGGISSYPLNLIALMDKYPDVEVFKRLYFYNSLGPSLDRSSLRVDITNTGTPIVFDLDNHLNLAGPYGSIDILVGGEKDKWPANTKNGYGSLWWQNEMPYLTDGL